MKFFNKAVRYTSNSICNVQLQLVKTQNGIGLPVYVDHRVRACIYDLELGVLIFFWIAWSICLLLELDTAMLWSLELSDMWPILSFLKLDLYFFNKISCMVFITTIFTWKCPNSLMVGFSGGSISTTSSFLYSLTFNFMWGSDLVEDTKRKVSLWDFVWDN